MNDTEITINSNHSAWDEPKMYDMTDPINFNNCFKSYTLMEDFAMGEIVQHQARFCPYFRTYHMDVVKERE